MVEKLISDRDFHLGSIFDSSKINKAIKTHNKNFTYKDWKAYLDTMLKQLDALSVGKGERIGIYLDNSIEFVALILCSMIRGNIFIPISRRWAEEDLKRIVDDFKIDHLFVTSLKQLLEGVKVHNMVAISRRVNKIYSFTECSAYDWVINLDQEVAIILNSPKNVESLKGYLYSFESLLYSAWGGVLHYEMRESSVAALSLPLCHMGGIMILLETTLIGGQLVIPPSLDHIENIIRTSKIEHLSTTSSFLIKLLDKEKIHHHLTKVKNIVVENGPLPKWSINYAKEKDIKVSIAYGLSENIPRISSTRPQGRPTYSAKSCGRILPFRKVDISNEKEISIGKKLLFKGHYHKKEFIPLNGDFFKSSELGIIDKNSHLQIIGKNDLAFSIDGEFIRPQIVEETIKQLPWIVEAIVINVNYQNNQNIPFAFIESMRKIPIKKVLNYLKSKLPPHLVPKNIIFLEAQNPYKEIRYNKGRLKEYALSLMKS